MINTNFTKEIFDLHSGDELQVTNLSLYGIDVKRLVSAFYLKCKQFNITDMDINHSVFPKQIFQIESTPYITTQGTLTNLSITDVRMGNVFKTKKAFLNISNFILTRAKGRPLIELLVVMNAFQFLEKSVINIQNLDVSDCTINDVLFQTLNSEVNIKKTNITKNKFASLLELSNSELRAIELQSAGNKGTKENKFLTAEGSSLNFINMSVRVPEISGNEKVADIVNTKFNFNNVEFRVTKSSYLQFQVFNSNFQDRLQYDLENFAIECPNNFNVIYGNRSKENSLNVFCQKCEKNTYPIESNGKRFKVDMKINRTNADEFENSVLKCQNCPTGAICTDGGIKARDNFHGFANEKKEYSFLLCPGDYCCSNETKECQTPTTCSFNRTGPFCGQCEKDHFVNLNNKCVHNSQCSSRSKYLFWILFLVAPITVALLLTLANDLKFLAIRCANWFQRCRRHQPRVQPDATTTCRSNINQKEISLSAIFNIVMNFYQLKALVTVQGGKKGNETNLILDHIFNIEWITEGRKEFDHLCPFDEMTVIHRSLLLGYIYPLTMVLTVLLCLTAFKIWSSLKCLNKNKQFFFGSFYVGYYIVLAFSYKNICHTAFSLINCKAMNGKTFLYINGSTECYQYWQIANFIFLVLWAFSFPSAVAIGYRKLKKREISRLRYTLFLTFPFVSYIDVLFKKFIRTEGRALHERVDDRLVEMFELPYKEKYIWWEAWRLMERFIIAGMSVFLTNPIAIYRVLYITLVFAFFCHLHRRVNPYKR